MLNRGKGIRETPLFIDMLDGMVKVRLQWPELEAKKNTIDV